MLVNAIPTRLINLKIKLHESEYAGIVITSEAGRLWLCGELRSDLLFVDRAGNIGSTLAEIEPMLAALRPCHIAIEPDMKGAKLLRLQKIGAGLGDRIKWCSSGLLGRCRSVKDESEVALMSQAAMITRRALDELVNVIDVGVSEVDVSNWLYKTFRELGADGFAFDPSVGSGRRGAVPWAGVSVRRITEGDSIVVDCGARIHGYLSDMTQTYFAPRNRKARVIGEMEEAVAAALDDVISVIRPGVMCGDLHRLAERSLRRFDPGNVLPHALGHGVGLEVHERPYLSSRSTDVLEPGMVVAIEPGVYRQDLGGVRTENMFLITETGAVRLETAAKVVRTLWIWAIASTTPRCLGSTETAA
jgi:Xaa-Pro aminopeptidase